MNDKLRRGLLIVAVFIVVGCSGPGREEGTLSGHVTIGPLQPVVQEGEPDPTPSPQVYAAWEVVVFTDDMEREVARADIDAAGNYEVTLAAGSYVVTTEPSDGRGGPGGSDRLNVAIIAAELTQLDLDIDTGIR